MPEPGGAGEVRAALSRLRRSSGVPVVFGGLLTDARGFRISELAGTTTDALRGLAICAGSGLGGKAVTLARPVAVADYRGSRVISHEYDAAVAAEGLCSVLAVPVVVRDRVRGVLYGALRQRLVFGDRALNAAVAAARELEQALAVREEAQRLLSEHRAPVDGSAAWEEVRAAHAELRALTHQVADARLRRDLLAACGRLAAACGPTAGGPPGGGTLAPREVDVLACVASGATNAAVGERLGLRPETVKSYLRSAMRKLGAHTRLEAVVAARRAGVLP